MLELTWEQPAFLFISKGRGVVLKEPSVVAFDRDTNKIKAIGEEARLMLGSTPGNIVAVRPLRQGVISDYHRNGEDAEAFHSEGSRQEDVPEAADQLSAYRAVLPR